MHAERNEMSYSYQPYTKLDFWQETQTRTMQKTKEKNKDIFQIVSKRRAV